LQKRDDVDLIKRRGMQNSIIYYLQIIGEEASAIPQDFRDHHTEIPWRQMISTRNKLIHHYEGIDLDIAWETATVSIPELRLKIDAILHAGHEEIDYH
jgi:uncharacterized protein with HEPN domain